MIQRKHITSSVDKTGALAESQVLVTALGTFPGLSERTKGTLTGLGSILCILTREHNLTPDQHHTMVSRAKELLPYKRERDMKPSRLATFLGEVFGVHMGAGTIKERAEDCWRGTPLYVVACATRTDNGDTGALVLTLTDRWKSVLDLMKRAGDTIGPIKATRLTLEALRKKEIHHFWRLPDDVRQGFRSATTLTKGGPTGSMNVQFRKMDWDSEKSYHSRILALELATNNGRLCSHQSLFSPFPGIAYSARWG